MNKLIKNSILLVLVVFIVVLAACSMIEKNDDSDSAANGIFIAPISKSVTEQINVSWNSPTTIIMSVALYKPADNEISASIEQNNDLVNTYNGDNNVDFTELPPEALTFSTKTPSIASGEKASDSVEVSVDTQFLEESTMYLLPIEIMEVSSSMVSMDESMSIKYYLLEVGSRPSNIIGKDK